jgi:hypothetical protein
MNQQNTMRVSQRGNKKFQVETWQPPVGVNVGYWQAQFVADDADEAVQIALGDPPPALEMLTQQLRESMNEINKS